MRKNVFLACALTLAAVSAPAFAGEAQGQQGFIRGEIGRTDFKIDGLGSDKDTAYGIGGGYWFNANWGIEGGYNRLYNGEFFRIPSLSVTAELQNFTVGGVAKKNFGADGNGFFLGGRAGYGFSSAKIRAYSHWSSASDTLSSSGLYYGVNAGYDINRNFGLGLNYTHYKAYSDADADVLGLSAEYRF